MDALYTYSIASVLAVALLLFFSAVLRGQDARGLGAYCLAVAVWSGALLLSSLPSTSHVGQKLVATGGYVVAAYLHAATNLTGQRRYLLVWLAYLMATAITLLHLLWPGMLFDPLTLRAGPWFWPAMAGAGAVSLFPAWHLGKHLLQAKGTARRQLWGLAAAGGLGYLGACANALLLSHGIQLPIGLFVVLGSLFILANVVRLKLAPQVGRVLQRSLTYSAIAAFLSAGFLFGVLALLESSRQALITEYRLSALFLLCMAALAFDPVRQHLGELLGRRLLKKTTGLSEMAAALAVQEQRADQAQRLAELGAFSSAVAHEVRGPLGVLSAQLRALESQRVDAESISAMRSQIKRAEHFVDDLLSYGRPRPLEVREVDLGALTQLAFSTARQSLALRPSTIELVTENQPEVITIEADQSQMLQLLVILLENAMLALAPQPAGMIRINNTIEGDDVHIVVEDNGPGIPATIRDEIFEPFVTGGAKRERAGTGLGLAIARGIILRHDGRISAGSSELGGARFELKLPRTQRVMAAAAGVT